MCHKQHKQFSHCDRWRLWAFCQRAFPTAGRCKARSEWLSALRCGFPKWVSAEPRLTSPHLRITQKSCRIKTTWGAEDVELEMSFWFGTFNYNFILCTFFWVKKNNTSFEQTTTKIKNVQTSFNLLWIFANVRRVIIYIQLPKYFT